MTGSIRYITHDNIDEARWNHCIDTSFNRLIYGYTFYLDAMAKKWDALVLDDYDAVMPLTWNRKWGIRYVYPPPFMQQLGIFSVKPIEAATAAQFIDIVKNHFRFAEICFNAFNPVMASSQKKNCILHLDKEYAAIQSAYKKDLLKNLRRAENLQLSYDVEEDYEKCIRSYITQYGSRIPHIKTSDYRRFSLLCHIVFEKKMLLARKVVLSNGELLAIALFFDDGKRLYNIMSTTLPQGRTLEANHFLLDNLVREFAGKNRVLDFEGSEIPGIENFYRQFGAIAEPYSFFRYNGLPYPLRLFKKG